MAEEGLAVQVATRALGTSESGFYAWGTRAPSARDIRHVLLTERSAKSTPPRGGSTGLDKSMPSSHPGGASRSGTALCQC